MAITRGWAHLGSTSTSPCMGPYSIVVMASASSITRPIILGVEILGKFPLQKNLVFEFYFCFCERIENSENNRILVTCWSCPQGYYGKVVPNKLYFWGFVWTGYQNLVPPKKRIKKKGAIFEPHFWTQCFFQSVSWCSQKWWSSSIGRFSQIFLQG